MSKYILNGFACSVTFLTFLFLSHTANATSLLEKHANLELFPQTHQVINLSLVSFSENNIEQSHNPILDHFIGCNCPTCNQSVKPISL